MIYCMILLLGSCATKKDILYYQLNIFVFDDYEHFAYHYICLVFHFVVQLDEASLAVHIQSDYYYILSLSN